MSAFTRTDKPVESRKSTPDRSTMMHPPPAPIAAERASSRVGAVNTSTSPTAATTVHCDSDHRHLLVLDHDQLVEVGIATDDGCRQGFDDVGEMGVRVVPSQRPDDRGREHHVADQPEAAWKFAGAARTRVGQELGVIAEGDFHLCWIVDFPMFEWNEEEKKIDFSHNPFSMPNFPVDEFLALDAKDDEKILGMKAIQYDIVCNGVELSSGAIRNHRPDVMKKAFAIAGYGEDVLEAKFGGMLRALSLGAPPHGGIAPGVDRIVMLLAEEENLREVVLFPMNQRAEDLLMGAPSEVTQKQLRELHIRLALPEKK